MKVIFRFLAKVFSDVAWFFAELSGDVEIQERDDGVIIRQVTLVRRFCKGGLRIKVIFRFLAKVFSDVAWFFAELSGDVETQTRDDGVIVRQVTYK